ncbi:glycosyltransferase [Streptomyces sp. NPDC052020]|uniref:glycosyltransferase n=1 Tax=Streptomyces sp. NPDC052020 TaxID=3155677 RepID=UPI0034199307
MVETGKRASVIVPTFNRAPLLMETLRGLARQDLDRSEFEVIVVDDGSTDETADVVESFTRRLDITYVFQEDKGFRVAAARNAGARLATGDVFAFLDTGAVVGPGYLRHHLALHADESEHRAVVGYAYAYRPEDPTAGLEQMCGRLLPERLLEVYAHDPSFWDIRHGAFLRCGWDLGELAVPWILLWATNCSVRADDYWAVDGFDEDFQRWGVEDMELGFRLFKHGVRFVASREGWAIETPHDRDGDNNAQGNRHNIGQLLAKHREPVAEIGWSLINSDLYWPWEDDYRTLLRWTTEARGMHVHDEIAAAVSDLGSGDRVAVIGCGGSVPEELREAKLFDFDATLLESRDRDETACHAIGLRTPLPDHSVDVVVLTSRLAGLWPRWNLEILAEARRIGREVRAPGLERW